MTDEQNGWNVTATYKRAKSFYSRVEVWEMNEAAIQSIFSAILSLPVYYSCGLLNNIHCVFVAVGAIGGIKNPLSLINYQ